MSDNIEISSENEPGVVPSENGVGAQSLADYHLISLTIQPSDGSDPVDFKPMFVEINYYEDIFNCVTSGDVIVSDAQGMIEKLGLCGSEYIKFTLSKDSDSPDDDSQYIIEKQFRIYKIGSRTKNNNEAVENYVIYFCSDEMLMNNQYRISKSYPYMTIKEMIMDIMENYLMVSDARYDPDNKFENTDGIYNFIIPNLKPFEAINWLMQYARPADNSSIGNDMIFFEDKESYVMASLQTLFVQDPIGTFKYQPKNLDTDSYVTNPEGDTSSLMFNVDHYEIENSFDTMEGINNGMLANQLMALNPLRQAYSTHKFNYEEYSSQAKSLNGNKIVNNLQNRAGDTMSDTGLANFKLAFSNTDNDQNVYVQSKPPGSITNSVFIEDVLTMRKAQLNLTNYHKVKLQMGGNPFLTVGQTLVFDLVSTTPSGSEDLPKNSDSLYAGKYLISAIRHLITTGGYSTIVEIVKDSLTNESDTVGLIDASNYDSSVQGVVDETLDWF